MALVGGVSEDILGDRSARIFTLHLIAAHTEAAYFPRLDGTISQISPVFWQLEHGWTAVTSQRTLRALHFRQACFARVPLGSASLLRGIAALINQVTVTEGDRDVSVFYPGVAPEMMGCQGEQSWFLPMKRRRASVISGRS